MHRRANNSVLASFVFLMLATAFALRAEAATVTVPAGGNIQSAINSNPAGTTYLLSGVYRMQSITPKNGDIFDGQNSATLNGSKLLTGWTQNGSRWSISGQTQQGPAYNASECLSSSPRCANPEDLYIDDVPMQHVNSLSAVGPGTWYFDYGADTIHIGDNPSGRKVETSVTAQAFGGNVSNVTIKNLIVEKYASPLQHGTVNAEGGSNWTMQDSTIRLNHGIGVNVGSGTKVLRNKILKNGMAGYDAGASGWLFEQNEIGGNGYAGVNFKWEGGGGKVTANAHATIRNNCVYNNRGPGIWMDIDANNVIVENNVVWGNTDNGIMYEISIGGIIRNNIVFDNGNTTIDKVWLWSPQILVSSSRNVKVYGNTVDAPVGYGNGITIISQSRPYTPATGNEIYNNTITLRDTTWGTMGAISDVGADKAAVAAQNSMHNNTYHVVNTSHPFWEWNGAKRTLSGMQSIGQETGSTVDGNLPSKPMKSCAFLNLPTIPVPQDSTPAPSVNISANTTSGQSPYGGRAHAIPGTIQAENYDTGGESVAYHDSETANQGGHYRSDGVDIKTASDTGGGYAVGWIMQTGEWLEYTVNVSSAGSYAFLARVATIYSGKKFHVEIDGVNVTGTLAVPTTATAWDTTWGSVTKSGINLTAGTHTMRVVADTDLFDMNYFTWTKETSQTTSTPAPTVTISGTPVSVTSGGQTTNTGSTASHGNTSPAPTAASNASGVKFASGDRAVTTDSVRVRPNATNLQLASSVQKTGASGFIVDGPVTTSSITRWKIDFDTGADGWVAEDYIRNSIVVQNDKQAQIAALYELLNRLLAVIAAITAGQQ